MVTCGFCGHEFEEDRGQPGCRACPLGADCGLIRCPKCGYENPGTPRWIAFLKKKLGRGAAAKRAPEPVTVSLPVLPLRRRADRHAAAGSSSGERHR